MKARTIKDAYRGYQDALATAHSANEHEIETRGAWEQLRVAGIANGEVTGKNADEREANAMRMYPETYRQMTEAAALARQARFEVEYTRARVEMLRVLLRLKELTLAAVPSHLR